MRRLARRAAFLCALLLALIALWWTLPALRAARVLVSIARQPAWAARFAPPTAGVTHEDLEVPTRHGPLAVRIHRPAGDADRTLVVVPGIHAGGVDEPRLAELSRRLAASGATVVSAPLPELRRYVVTARSTDAIEDVVSYVAAEPALAPDGRIALVGVSFAGGLAIVAAGRPAIADRLTAVVSIGGHGDLPRVMTYLATGETASGAHVPPHDYGVAVILYGAADRLVPGAQVEPLRRTLRAWLDAGSASAASPDLARDLFAEAASLAGDLPDPARTFAERAIARDVAALGPRVRPFIEDLGGASALSPERSPPPAAPVFLLHGDTDPLVPPDEAARLAADLRARGARVEMLVTPLLWHADVRSAVDAADAWALIRFWTRLLAAT